MALTLLRATGQQRAIDTAAVRAAIAVLCDPDYGIMVQSLPSGESFTAPSCEIGRLVDAVAALPDGTGKYYSLNPCPLDWPERACIKSTNVVRRRWLLIDVDPTRTDGEKVNATDAEHEESRKVLCEIMDYLSDLGWPLPLIIDSGNGWHLLYRIDLPNNAVVQNTIRSILDLLGKTFDTATAHVDKSVHDAKRIAKLPGTWACKGPHSLERPHRMARIEYAPDVVGVVPSNQLTELAATKVIEPKRVGFRKLYASDGTTGNDQAWGRAALARECARIAAAPMGERNNTLFKAVANIAEIVNGGHLLGQEAEEAIYDRAIARGLDEKEARHTIQSGIRKVGDKARHPKDKPFSKNGIHKPQEAGNSAKWCFTDDGEVMAEGDPASIIASTDADIGETKSAETFELMSLPALLAAEFPTPIWVVPGILSEGLNILAGKPKLGKSMLALNLAMTIAGGGNALKSIRTVPGDILYLALEDKYRRLQTRARMMVKGLDCEASKRLKIITRWPRQADGGLRLLDLWAKSVERPTLLIIDVWTMFRPAYHNGSQYEQDYQHMAEIKRWVDKRGCTALVLHHCRKGASEDVLEEVSGTMGLTGVADGIMVLTRSRNNNEAKISVTGRDVEESELAIEFDPATLTWKSLGSAEAHLTGKLQTLVIGYLKARHGEGCFAADIARQLNQEPDSVRKILHRLFDRKLVRRIGNAWAYPGEGDEAEAQVVEESF